MRVKDLIIYHENSIVELELKIKVLKETIISLKELLADDRNMADRYTLERAKGRNLEVNDDYSTMSFKALVVKILTDTGWLLNSKEIFKYYIDLTGKDIKFNTFSSQLSLATGKGNRIKKYVNDLALSKERRHLYGLESWFNDGIPKDNYLNMEELFYGNLKKTTST